MSAQHIIIAALAIINLILLGLNGYESNKLIRQANELRSDFVDLDNFCKTRAIQLKSQPVPCYQGMTLEPGGSCSITIPLNIPSK